MKALVVSERRSHVPLQKLLYFNTYYAPAFGAAHIALVVLKLAFLNVSRTTTIVLPILVSIWVVLETARLYLGYAANLHSRIVALAQFGLVTAFLSLPIVAFLSFGQGGDSVPLDLAVGLPLVALYAAQLRAAFSAANALRQPQQEQRVASAARQAAPPRVASPSSSSSLEPAAAPAHEAATVPRSSVGTAQAAPGDDRGSGGDGDAAAAAPATAATAAAAAAESAGAGGRRTRRPAGSSMTRSLWAVAEASVRHVMNDSGGIFGSATGGTGAPPKPAAAPTAAAAAPAPRSSSDPAPPRIMVARASAYKSVTNSTPSPTPPAEPAASTPAPPAASPSPAAPAMSLREVVAEGWRHMTQDKGGLFGDANGLGGAMIAPTAADEVGGAGAGGVATAQAGDGDAGAAPRAAAQTGASRRRRGAHSPESLRVVTSGVRA